MIKKYYKWIILVTLSSIVLLFIFFFDFAYQKRREADWTIHEFGNDIIKVITFDKLGRTWVGTTSGVSVLDGETWTHFQNQDYHLPDNTVETIAFDVEENVWIGTFGTTETIETGGYRFYGEKGSGGISIFDGENWTAYTKENSGINGEYVTSIAFDPQGHVWIGTTGGINIFDGKNWNLLQVDNTIQIDTGVKAIAFDQKGRAWISFGSKGGYGGPPPNGLHILTINNGGYKLEKYQDQAPNSITFDNQGHFVVDTPEGKPGTRFNDLNSPLEKGNTTFSVDPIGRIWIGSQGVLLEALSSAVPAPVPDWMISLRKYFHPLTIIFWIGVIIILGVGINYKIWPGVLVGMSIGLTAVVPFGIYDYYKEGLITFAYAVLIGGLFGLFGGFYGLGEEKRHQKPGGYKTKMGIGVGITGGIICTLIAFFIYLLTR